MLKILTLILLGLTLYNTSQFIWYWFSFVAALEILLLFVTRTRTATPNKIRLNQDQLAIFQRHHFTFSHPLTSQKLSTTLSLIAFAGIVLAGWLAYQEYYVLAFITFVNYFLAQHLSARLNPLFYLEDKLKRKPTDADNAAELLVFQGVLGKLQESENPVEQDELYTAAMEFCDSCDSVRASDLQRKFTIGYSRANRLLTHWQETQGIPK